MIVSTNAYKTYKDLVLSAEAAYAANKGNDDFCSVNIVGFYEEIAEVLAIVMKDSNLKPFILDLAPVEDAGYSHEYVLSLSFDGTVSVEKLRKDNGVYLDLCHALTFVGEQCNSRIITSHQDTPYIVYSISEDGIYYGEAKDSYTCEDDEVEEPVNSNNDYRKGNTFVFIFGKV